MVIMVTLKKSYNQLTDRCKKKNLEKMACEYLLKGEK